MSILFLTGATVTFRPLLDHIVQTSFLKFLQEQGFDRISIQYGNETDAQEKEISKHYFNLLLMENKVIEQLDLLVYNVTNDKSFTILGNLKLKLQVFGYAENIGAYIAEADLVVSHGGTGSILDTLRLGKPLLVVANDLLMHNHQMEVAEQFDEEGYLKAMSCSDLSKGALEENIQSFQSGSLGFKILEPPPTGVLQSVIEQLE